MVGEMDCRGGIQFRYVSAVENGCRICSGMYSAVEISRSICSGMTFAAVNAHHQNGIAERRI
jgi:hypothetical protein